MFGSGRASRLSINKRQLSESQVMISEEDNEEDSNEDSDDEASLKNRDLTDEEFPCDTSMKKLDDLDPDQISMPTAVKPEIS